MSVVSRVVFPTGPTSSWLSSTRSSSSDSGSSPAGGRSGLASAWSSIFWGSSESCWASEQISYQLLSKDYMERLPITNQYRYRPQIFNAIPCISVAYWLSKFWPTVQIALIPVWNKWSHHLPSKDFPRTSTTMVLQTWWEYIAWIPVWNKWSHHLPSKDFPRTSATMVLQTWWE